MGAGYTRSHRINRLVKMALAGKSFIEIENRALSWGISTATVRDYLRCVKAITKRYHTNQGDNL